MTTKNPIQLLNPVGSTAGQAIVSTGPAAAPAWGTPSLAAPGAIGGTTPAAGSFTTLTASQTSKVFAQNTSAQSIPSSSATVVTGWTTVFDQHSDFVASTGTFTAPVTAYYLVSVQLNYNGAMTSGAIIQTQIFANGANVAAGIFLTPNAANATNGAAVTALVKLTAGQTIQVKALQTNAGAFPLNSAATLNSLSIAQIP
jgi:hypothetical protein